MIGRSSLRIIFIIIVGLLFFLTGISLIEDHTLKLQEKANMKQLMEDTLACKTKGVLPSGGFCLNTKNQFKGCANAWDSTLCEGLENIFGYSSVGDMGCGRGFYGGCFLRLNNSIITYKGEQAIAGQKKTFMTNLMKSNLTNKPKVIRSWEGFEATSNVEEESGGLIHVADLSKPLDLGYKFDWVMSIEVGEHIPKIGESSFLDNIVKHACKGVVLSWAVPGQNGFHHVNNKPNTYVIEKMRTRGLDHDEVAEKRLREMAYIRYLRNTLMVFRFPQERC